MFRALCAESRRASIQEGVEGEHKEQQVGKKGCLSAQNLDAFALREREDAFTLLDFAVWVGLSHDLQMALL